ncbi:nucleotidyl transferase AbiEii/AbiGii toxin family protein [Geobacter sp.]|uniref:nucleotidyl transferase AbiEii/AbiGii toxin family protein n=1 Tax=Geobacter sp. TaxID=46610 RepID=UPI002622849E|nr:nucleotidyl transferase AbiEii/AbiGii toxin family protein [Geobacter sp.]
MLFLDIFRRFNEKGLDYVIIGGVALLMHGVVRLTADLDLMVALEHDNLRKLIDVMAELGYRPRIPEPAGALLDSAKRQGWIDQKNMEVFSFYDPGQPVALIDIMIHEPVDYRTLRERAVMMDINELSVPVASREDLIAMKRISGRPQDIEDVKALERLADHD